MTYTNDIILLIHNKYIRHEQMHHYFYQPHPTYYYNLSYIFKNLKENIKAIDLFFFKEIYTVTTQNPLKFHIKFWQLTEILLETSELRDTDYHYDTKFQELPKT